MEVCDIVQENFLQGIKTIPMQKKCKKAKWLSEEALQMQYVNRELPVVQAGFRKGRGTRYRIANISWIIKKARDWKTSTSALLTMPKALTVWITTNFGNFLKRWEYQTS